MIPKTIPQDHEDRLKAPPYVWDWRDYASWRETVWALLNPIVDERVKAAFHKSPPEYLVSDDLDWLDNIIFSVTGEYEDSKEFLADKIHQHYQAFRAVHGTRNSSLTTFYEQGLLPLEPSKIHDQARSIFLDGRFPELTEEHLQTAIREVDTATRENRVYFDANEEMLLKFGGQYMLFGSEYLLCIAGALRKNREDQRLLNSIGVPVVFVCDIPLNLMSRYTILEFSGMALEIVFRELLDGKDFERDPYQGGGLSIQDQLPPECIVGHYHPEITRDPLGLVIPRASSRAFEVKR